MMNAWNEAAAREEEINQELMDELMDAQMTFEQEVMQAQQTFENELTQNGAMADWEALEDKINRDMQAMRKFSNRVQLLRTRTAVMERANAKMNMNLARMSEEMAANPPNPEEWDAMKTKLTDWSTRYDDIAERARPHEELRNNK